MLRAPWCIASGASRAAAMPKRGAEEAPATPRTRTSRRARSREEDDNAAAVAEAEAPPASRAPLDDWMAVL